MVDAVGGRVDCVEESDLEQVPSENVETLQLFLRGSVDPAVFGFEGLKLFFVDLVKRTG